MKNTKEYNELLDKAVSITNEITANHNSKEINKLKNLELSNVIRRLKELRSV